MKLTCLTMLTVLCGVPSWGSQSNPTVKAVYLRGSDLFVADSANPEGVQLTHDGAPKSHPVWSRDGRTIAYQRAGKGHPLGDLVVISTTGEILHEIPFRATNSEVSGMRFVEELEWSSDEVLVVSGSVNPSTGEYALVDVKKGKEVADYLVDGFRWASSPDGNHAAYVGYIPHSVPEADRRPQFCLDDECSFDKPARGFSPRGHVEFLTEPVWSAEGMEVAIGAEDFNTKARVLIVRSLGGRASTYSVPAEVAEGFKIVWTAKGWAISAPGGSAWELATSTSEFIPATQSLFELERVQARQFKNEQSVMFERFGGREIDLWCESCVLRLLPRQGRLQ